MAAKPSGTINVGQKEIAPFMGHPKLAGNPQVFVNSAVGVTESMAMNDPDGILAPMLATSWSVSEDFITWTFKLRKGVQFQKGYGEMKASDVAWSHEMIATSERHPRASDAKDIWLNENGSVTTPDDYTIVLNTGEPFSDIGVKELMGTPRSSVAYIVSKKQNDEIGEEETNRNTAATGPWEIEESRSAEFWRLRAVEDHWRKTPAFAELVLWEVPEEAARVAGFQTGNLDTSVIALDSLGLIEQVEGARFMQVPGAGQAGLHLYGQQYVVAGEGKADSNYHPDLPWVSPDADLDSEEWAKARKVRLALSIAIDRQLLVDTLLKGFGHPLAAKEWAGPDEARIPARMVWDFDPARAKQLLSEAGYPNGFSMTLTPSIRNAPAEVEACEAIAQMWDDIGVTVEFQRIPYSALRPQLVGRTYQGATCHSSAIRLAPTHGLANYTDKSTFNYGSSHPWLEERTAVAKRTIPEGERHAIELETLEFMFDEVFGQFGLYVFDNIWAVGPKLELWEDHIKRGDLRQMNGFEWIEHRK
jgi:peptide/nickel transport system substrate-binding protein